MALPGPGRLNLLPAATTCPPASTPATGARPPSTAPDAGSLSLQSRRLLLPTPAGNLFSLPLLRLIDGKLSPIASFILEVLGIEGNLPFSNLLVWRESEG
jgi:hypothetical protein